MDHLRIAFIWIFAFLAVITICYLFCPKIFIRKKNEYVAFFLLFLSVYSGIAAIVGNSLGQITLLCFFPALFLFHLLYPFKEMARNQHLSFFMFFLALISAGLIGLMFLISISNM